MKKSTLFYSLLFIVALVACSKDDDDKTPSFSKEGFVGTWEDKDTGSNGCHPVIQFTDTHYSYGTKCNTTVTLYSGSAYTFDNKNTVSTTTVSGEMKYVIISLTTETLVTDIYLKGKKTGTTTFTKVN
jgi:hypothetical protein